MKKADITDKVQAELQCGPEQAKAIVEDFFSLIEQGVLDDEKTSLSQFGSFVRTRRAARPARDVARNASVMLPARDVVTFRAAPALRREIANATGHIEALLNPE